MTAMVPGRLIARVARFAWVRTLGALLAPLLLGALVWLGGLVWFAETIPREGGTGAIAGGSGAGTTDAIIVLTGGSDRIATGIDLLDRGLARKLLISGVSPGVEMADVLRAASIPEGGRSCCVVLGYAAGNTIGNAAEAAAWMRAEGYRSLRLVTANYHMRRSLLEFRMTMPEFRIVQHPVVPDKVHLDRWWQWPGTASLIVNEYNKFLVTALRYWLYPVTP